MSFDFSGVVEVASYSKSKPLFRQRGIHQPHRVLQQTRLVSKGLRELFFCDTVTDHVGFQAPLTAALFLLPVYHGECEIQCHENVKPTF